MKNGESKQLRSSKATVYYYEQVYVKRDDRDIWHELHDAYILRSYDSYVAIYGKARNNLPVLCLLKYFDCSNTTMQHVRKFQEDYTMETMPIKRLREIIKASKISAFGDHYVYYIKRFKV